jgi:4-hydroxyphenylpyruvate dioxygenase-like putative hemolysin
MTVLHKHFIAEELPLTLEGYEFMHFGWRSMHPGHDELVIPNGYELVFRKNGNEVQVIRQKQVAAGAPSE